MVRLDNSAFTLYMKCPKMYYERYEAPNAELQGVQDAAGLRGVRPPHEEVSPEGVHGAQTGVHAELLPTAPASTGLELASRSRDGLDFGTRFHELAHARRLVLLGRGSEHYETTVIPELLAAEVEATFAAYEQHWLGSELTYIESERTHVLPLPASKHELVVKIDAVCRFADGTIGPLDTKTESKPGYNFREDWAGRTQASLYLWALKELYPGERVSRLVVDVVTRGGPKRACSFSRIDDIARPQDALDDAIQNVIWVCEDIEISRRTQWWRSNMNLCKEGWKRCDYFDLHVYGRTKENLAKYKPAEAYLEV